MLISTSKALISLSVSGSRIHSNSEFLFFNSGARSNSAQELSVHLPAFIPVNGTELATLNRAVPVDQWVLDAALWDESWDDLPRLLIFISYWRKR